MSDKKHIDRLFQEKLKDLEAIPDEAVWDTIHDRLHDNKRERRVIPLWWKLAGVAALLALLFTLGIKLVSADFDPSSKNPIVDTEKPSSGTSNNASQHKPENSTDIQNQMDDASMVGTKNDPDSETISKTSSDQTHNNVSEKNRANQNITTSADENQDRIVNSDQFNPKANRTTDKLNGNGVSGGSNKENNTNTANEVIAEISKNSKSGSDQHNMDAKIANTEIDKRIEDSKYLTDPAISNASKKTEELIVENKKEDQKTELSIEDAVAETNTEDEKEQEKKQNRWNISPNVAPVYFNSLGKGSSLDGQFVNNTKEGEITMSYGIGGSYAINDRLKVRAGVNKVAMGYSTQNVIAFRSIDSMSQTRSHNANINVSADTENMTYLSSASLNTTITPEIINTKTQGSIDQRFRFIEVPIEVEYVLVNKKVGVNVIGGFSTFIVDKNDIYSVVNGVETRIGEANNINNMSYSANFGLGINYNLSEKIKVNVEPTFKYQINTFNNSSGDFQPYFIGIYTGLSYKF